ncbi:MAG TPA: SIMPL domain-containing protein [Solirubrobacteraceae bacterium]|nr:SIMPL domain-containing protein [Solirubrobacteraceae bacterium]
MALTAVAGCLVGALCGSVAGAQADTTGATGTTGSTGASAATIMVNGSSTFTVDQNASAGAISSGYLGALESALTDAHTKASALASSVGDTLGVVQNITEQSSDGGLCSARVFANAVGSVHGAPAPSPAKKHHHKKKKSALRRIARIADASSSCSVEADVTVTYAMS